MDKRIKRSNERTNERKNGWMPYTKRMETAKARIAKTCIVKYSVRKSVSQVSVEGI